MLGAKRKVRAEAGATPKVSCHAYPSGCLGAWSNCCEVSMRFPLCIEYLRRHTGEQPL